MADLEDLRHIEGSRAVTEGALQAHVRLLQGKLARVEEGVGEPPPQGSSSV